MNGLDQGVSERDYRDLCSLIRAECGIVFAEGKRLMVEARLRRRARALGMDSLTDYCNLLRTPEGRVSERPSLIDAITTHKTDFYREPAHFDYLVARAVPDLVAAAGAGIRRPLEVWSAACSTGEEPFTLAMVLSECARTQSAGDFRCRVTATDISEAVIATGITAVYPESAVRRLPPEFNRYLLRSRNPSRGMVRIVPEIRALVQFHQLNLMDGRYEFRQPFDLVFCRNVMIYFDRSTQASVLRRIVAALRPGGYLFMGHAESLCGFDLPLQQVATTVHRRTHA